MINTMPALFDYHVTYSDDYYQHCTAALDFALQHVPAYQGWRAYDPGPSTPVDLRYAALPVLTKHDLRAHSYRGFIGAGRDARAALRNGTVELVETSGTTAERVTNLWHQPWWDASERASWLANTHAARAATGTHREALLASARSVGICSDAGDLAMAQRTDGRFLFLNEKSSPVLWQPHHLERMCRELSAYQPVVLEANPSYLARLARYILAHNLTVFTPQLIVLTFELPSRLHLDVIRRVFTSPIVSSYGSTEAGFVFTECEYGCFHQNCAFCRVDLQPLRPEHGGPALARILVTTFDNPWFALLRFDIGDLVRVRMSGACPCGRTGGIVADAIEGRLAHLTFTTRGRAVTVRALDAALAGAGGIAEYELRQTAPAHYHLRVIPAASATPHLADTLSAALRAVYGDEAQITIALCSSLAPGPSGKFSLARAAHDVSAAALLDPRWV